MSTKSLIVYTNEHKTVIVVSLYILMSTKQSHCTNEHKTVSLYILMSTKQSHCTNEHKTVSLYILMSTKQSHCIY